MSKIRVLAFHRFHILTARKQFVLLRLKPAESVLLMTYYELFLQEFGRNLEESELENILMQSRY